MAYSVYRGNSHRAFSERSNEGNSRGIPKSSSLEPVRTHMTYPREIDGIPIRPRAMPQGPREVQRHFVGTREAPRWDRMGSHMIRTEDLDEYRNWFG